MLEQTSLNRHAHTNSTHVIDVQMAQATRQSGDRTAKVWGLEGSEEWGEGDWVRALTVRNKRECLIATPAMVYSKKYDTKRTLEAPELQPVEKKATARRECSGL